MSVTTRRRGGWALAISVPVLTGCGSAAAAHPAATVTVTAPASSAPVGSPAASAAGSPAPPPASVSPAPPPGIGGEPGYPVGGPAADITSTGCTLTEQGDPSVGNRYYNVHMTLTVVAFSEITINKADVEVLGADASEIGSLQVIPVSASSSTISAPLVVTSGTVPFTGVADQMALSGQFSSACKVVSVSYDDGDTAP